MSHEKKELFEDLKQEIHDIFSKNKGKHFSFLQVREKIDDLLIDRLSEPVNDIKLVLKELYADKKIKSKKIDSVRIFYVDKPSVFKNLAMNILILFVTILLIFTIGEVSMRIKYAKTDVFATEYDRMEMNLYKQLTDTTNPNRFMYGLSPRWGYDPNLGLVPKAGYKYDVPFNLEINDTHYAKAVIRVDDMNAQGMRQMKDVTLEKTPGMYRIALLGDSFTLGDDVQTKHSFASQLTEIIPNSEIVNVGMSGKSTTYMYASYVKKAEQYNPDMTVMNILVDDLVRDRNGQPMFQQPYVYVNASNELEISNEHLFSYEEFLEEYKPPVVKSYLLTHLENKFSTINYKKTVKEHSMDMLGRIVDDMNVRTNGKFMVTLFLGWSPIQTQEEYKYDLYESAKKVLEEKNITYFDAELFFRDEVVKYTGNYTPQAVVDVFYQGVHERGHFSQIGYATFANEIKNNLIANGFYSGETLNPEKFIYVPDQQVIVYLDVNNQAIHYVPSYDVLEIVKK